MDFLFLQYGSGSNKRTPEPVRGDVRFTPESGHYSALHQMSA
jgi:hypothetical protein